MYSNDVATLFKLSSKSAIITESKPIFPSVCLVSSFLIFFSLFFLLTDQIWSKGLKWIIEKGSGF